ncbi:MAG TPA: hypothetical protein VER96_04740 [Polyangiaceae bacterium]|nr:hypothetical protein [Polyangiaceae bacterium]
MAISGDTIVMGPFVLRLQGLVWALKQTLAAGAPGGGSDPFDDPDPGTATFASAVAVSGDTIAISAPGDNEAAHGGGAVHIYRRVGSSWVWQQKLLPTLPDGTQDGSWGEGFGSGLALSENTLAVAATEDDDSSGSVYVFRRGATGFVPEAKLSATLPGGAPDGEAYSRFGTSVAVSGDRIVVGSGREPGAAYVFDRSGAAWSPQAKFLPPPHVRTVNSGEMSIFGAAVAVAGDTIVVGEPFVAGLGTMGTAYVFERSDTEWAITDTLQPAAPSLDGENGRFGISTAISSARDLILIGSDFDTHAGNYYPGSGHVFKRKGPTWSFDSQLLAAVSRVDELNPYQPRMGLYAAISGDQLLLGGETTSYLFTPKNDSWDTRLVIPISGLHL